MIFIRQLDNYKRTNDSSGIPHIGSGPQQIELFDKKKGFDAFQVGSKEEKCNAFFVDNNRGVSDVGIKISESMESKNKRAHNSHIIDMII